MSNQELENIKPRPLYISPQKHKPKFVGEPINNDQSKEQSTVPISVSGMYINYIKLPTKEPLQTRILAYISKTFKRVGQLLRLSF
jgi:hypothetical protein